MRPPRMRLVLALAGLVVLAGCSGGAGDAGGTAPTSGSTPSAVPNGTLEVHFINVGQSVSMLLVTPAGETMLIDTGDFRNDGAHVLQYLRRHDVDRIDHLVVSHNDADHIGGNAAIIDHYETEADGIGAIYDPGIAASTQTYMAYLDAVERHDVRLFETRAGDRIPFGDDAVGIQVLGPPEPYLENGARNENSIVLKVTFGRTSFLFTGDAEDDQEAHLVEQYGDQLQATVLKAGHHGSKSSTSGPLLDAVGPEAVVVSSAYDSPYGHPHDEVLQRLAARSIPTYWTGTHGDIVLVSDGRGISVRTQQAAPTDPSSLRDGEPVAPGTVGAVTERARLGGSPVAGGTSSPDGATATPTPTPTDGGAQLAVAEIHTDAAHTHTVPDGVPLESGAPVTITGSRTDTATELYWGRERAVWNNDGDTITVRAADGTIVLEEGY